MSNRAWVTLATNDSYSLGALVLGHSLRRAASAYPAVVLITPSVTEVMRERLRAVFAEVVVVDVLDSGDAAHLALLQRPELGITFTKIHCWGLTQYEKCVFLDADALIVQNSDELFEREELSAAPDVGWPDCFNSGVFVFKPSQETFDQLIKFAQERGSFDGGDQGLLNSFFSDWARGDINKHLPFLYNVTSAAFYSYLPALKHYGQNLKIIHFIGSTKPWLQQFNWESRSVGAPEHLREFLQLWWDLFVGQVHSQLDVSMVEVPEAPPVLPPHDASYYYTPVIDPESEFPWHHPDAQIPENTQRPEIDLTQFHDPWEIYGGQIPSYIEDTSNQQTLSGRMNDHEEMKKIAWEYQPSYKENSSEPSAQESVTHHFYQQEQTYQHFDHSHQETHSQPHHTEYHWEAQSQHSLGHDHSSYSYHQHSQEHHQHDMQEHSQLHQERHSSQEHHQYYEDQHHHDNRQEYSHQVHEPYPHDHHHTHSHHTHDQHVQHIHTQTPTEHLQTDFYHSHLEEKSDTAHSKHKHESYVNKIIPHVNTMQRIQQIHIYHNEVEIERNHEEEPLNANEITNGDFSDSECDYHEDIRPRHPYDGFYLRHRSTIDSYGRKVCTHEIPPTPTPSPSTDYESEDEAPFSLPEEIPLTNGHVEEQSGVAGNLARVVPGAVGAQREALDELTRRQGWEAGNIDYMGADSFENIWAKISQTLNQSAASLPKQPSPPPKQPSPPKEVPVEVAQEASAVESVVAPAPVDAAPATVETVAAPLETAPVLPIEAPASVPVETIPAAPVESSPVAPVEAAAPVAEVPVAAAATVAEATVAAGAPVATAAPVAGAPVATAAPVAGAPVAAAAPVEGTPAPATVEPLTAVGAPTLTETPAVIEAPSAPEPAKPATSEVEVPAPVEVPTPVEAAAEVKSEVPAAEIPATVVAASAPAVDPLEIPATVEACAPGEPASAEAPSTQSAEAAPEPPKVEPTKTEPALPPTPPASPKSPGASTPEIVPQVEPVLEVVEAAKEAVPVEGPKDPAPSPASPASPDAAKSVATPEKPSEAKVCSESPPLANTPSKDKAPALPAAKSEERRKGGCKLQLKPPAGADPLPTPDSEQEDAASLATSIIASELRTPTVSSPASPPAPASPPTPVQPHSLSVDEPELPTPPVGAVSLAQIGVKTPKPKATIAAQIESSAAQVDKPSEPITPTDAPKKKIVKKVVKKDKEGASSAGADAPVPPPRKKEKKPKEK